MSFNPFAGYRITSSFGYRIHPIHGGQTFHRGIDLVTEPWNGPVYAFMEGTVQFAAEGATGSGFGGYGLTVAIQDHRGYLHCYSHLSRIAVSEGQRVKRGQLLGNQGSTGHSTGPHVHYEIRKASTPSYGYTASVDGVVEPEAYLQSEFGSISEEQEAPPMTSEEKKAFEAMEKALQAQASWIAQQKQLSNMPCPPWAVEAYNYYRSFITTDTGSYDFWRLLVIMYRKEKGIKVPSDSEK
ncbi:M23 family metallopeptidase [Paenibacillus xylanilyticus]|uniref:M23 family metallopeptidase n=1 Tax=Paenibacillus xylanilyticus TaxID=248903 RepID=A0A7Y6C4K3_9BACL|nr:M23 family metallopeptidase [Paenibacillus xylanilyticus]NUU80086.1 M23 family metallopeptidase [Paenibacillus xylanilyticus]